LPSQDFQAGEGERPGHISFLVIRDVTAKIPGPRRAQMEYKRARDLDNTL
jgi:hypothetical protein